MLVREGFKEQRVGDGGCGRIEEERGIGKVFEFGEFGEFTEHVFGEGVNNKISWGKDI
jgi:hypothetical protein